MTMKLITKAQIDRINAVLFADVTHGLRAAESSAEWRTAANTLSNALDMLQPDDWLRYLGWDDPDRRDDIRARLGFDPTYTIGRKDQPGSGWVGIQRTAGLTLAVVTVGELLTLSGSTQSSPLHMLRGMMEQRMHLCGETLDLLGKMTGGPESGNDALYVQEVIRVATTRRGEFPASWVTALLDLYRGTASRHAVRVQPEWAKRWLADAGAGLPQEGVPA